MSIKETEAIVIKSYNLSEADRIVVFFTREYGVIRGVAKGAKRLQSRFGSMLEPFSTVTVSFFQKEERELVTLREIELIESRFARTSEPAFLEAFSYIGELLTDFAPPHDADEKLYRMITACLSAAQDEAGLGAVRLYFELWLLRLSGFLPQWEICHLCSRPLGPDESARLISGFHLSCSNCRGGYAISEVTADDRRFYADVLRMSPVDFVVSAAGRRKQFRVISDVLSRLIAQALGREVAGGAALS